MSFVHQQWKNCIHVHVSFQLKVPLGVILKNENKLEDMIDIVDELKYVPQVRTTQSFETVQSNSPAKLTVLNIDHFNHILIGGDQLTCATVRGSQRIRGNSYSGRDRLEGLIPVSEDWHAKMCLMKV